MAQRLLLLAPWQRWFAGAVPLVAADDKALLDAVGCLFIPACAGVAPHAAGRRRRGRCWFRNNDAGHQTNFWQADDNWIHINGVDVTFHVAVELVDALLCRRARALLRTSACFAIASMHFIYRSQHALPGLYATAAALFTALLYASARPSIGALAAGA